MSYPIGEAGLPSAFEVTVLVTGEDEETQKEDKTVVIALTIEDGVNHVCQLLNEVYHYGRGITRDDVLSIKRLNHPDEGVYFTKRARAYFKEEEDGEVDYSRTPEELEEERIHGIERSVDHD